MALEKYVVGITHHEGFIQSEEFRFVSDEQALQRLHDQFGGIRNAISYRVYENQQGFELPGTPKTTADPYPNLDVQLQPLSGWVYPDGKIVSLEEIKEMGNTDWLLFNVRQSDTKKAVQTRLGTWALFNEGDSVEFPNLA